MSRVARSTILAGLIVAGVTWQAQAAPPTVEVTLGPAVLARQGELGRSDLEDARAYLARAVAGAAGHSAAPPRSVRLVIEDIQPTRPTSAQLGASAALDAAGRGLGGAAVSGEVVMADGRQAPVRFRDFQTDRRNQTDFTTWGDADQAFDTLAAAVGSGRPPDDERPWPPPHRPQTPTGTRVPG